MEEKQKNIKEQVLKIAKEWQLDIQLRDKGGKGFASKIDKLLTNPKNKVFLIELLDQSFRSRSYMRIDNQIRYVLKKYEMNKIMDSGDSFFNFFERILVSLYYLFGRLLPLVSVRIFKEKIRMDSSSFVVKKENFEKFAEMKYNQGIHVNMNKIGESVSGEKEAVERLNEYVKVMKESNIGHIAIKISTIYSQVHSIGIHHVVNILVERLSMIYRAAKDSYYKDSKGNKYSKWVHLDMEEYRDLEITVEVFFKTLEQDEFKNFDRAGIAIQAYMPDALIWYEKILDFAKKRVSSGGAPVKIRLVKGANMEMEMTESALRNWKLVTYSKKVETDANYKKILSIALKEENAKYVRFGIGSHNLFDVIYGYILAQEYNSSKYVFFEMLEGMADELRGKLLNNLQSILLYVPTASSKDFTSAIGYLVRRLDENTNKDNFMRYSFGLKVDSAEYKMLEDKFVKSLELMDSVYVGRYRDQNRLTEKWDKLRPNWKEYKFINESDTDFALKENRTWADEIVKKWKDKNNMQAFVVVAGKEEYGNRVENHIYDHCQKDKKGAIGKWVEASSSDMKLALNVAKEDKTGWRKKSLEDIYTIFSKAANLCRERRGDLIGIASAELGKVFTETDVEVSEAIDFINFYSYAACVNKKDNLMMKAKDVVVVIAPWNFPIAIPIGGIAAALAVGSRVIFKPSSDSVLCGYESCKIFWDAGVPKEVLQFIPSRGSDFGEDICKSDIVDAIILTGGESTAYRIMKDNPKVLMTAEAGGKNAMIIGTLADIDYAVMSLLTSGFSNSGQKCSAASLLLVSKIVYNDPKFRMLLKDSVESLEVGSSWDLNNKISRLAKKISGPLEKAINHLEPHEEWLVAPSYAEDNQYMLKPSIRMGTRRGDYTHKTELFGPHVSVMQYEDLEDAISIVHETGYGLTSGFHSLDEREKEYYLNHIHAGNIYINRGMTGAIVMRQPFGGVGKSSIGGGRKVGYYNYLIQFMNLEDNVEYYSDELKKDFYELNKVKIDLKKVLDQFYQEIVFENEGYKNDMKCSALALRSYVKAKNEHFMKEWDEFKLRGEDNYLRYKPVKKILIRVVKGDKLADVMFMLLGSLITGATVYLNYDRELESVDYLKILSKYHTQFGFEILNDNESELKDKIEQFDRVRYSSRCKVESKILEKVSETGYFINCEKPVMEGRYELLNYYYEQAVSHSYHRYGNLGARGVHEDK